MKAWRQVWTRMLAGTWWVAALALANPAGAVDRFMTEDAETVLVASATVATTAHGVHPAARSSATARARAVASRRYSASTGIFRNPSCPTPRTMAAFSIEEWASVDV